MLLIDVNGLHTTHIFAKVKTGKNFEEKATRIFDNVKYKNLELFMQYKLTAQKSVW